ncbi:MAG: DUF4410 domain-containing protein [Methylohalobius sp.]|nr:DUF4410 domain-containing protein [Methylohalobius sp.]
MLRHSVGIVLFLGLVGCGSVRHEFKLTEGYRPPASATVTVGQVRDLTRKYPDIDPPQRLKDALVEALKEEGLLGTEGRPLVLDAEIVEYEPGSAFKRWLLPGYGATILTVRAQLKDQDAVVGTAEARRTVSFGGGYSIGAWKGIFQDVAEDLVQDLKGKIRG